jgi:hypothetical protein
LAIVFDDKGSVAGNFLHPAGARCEIQSGQASIQIPPLAASSALDVAVGAFVVACMGTDGSRMQLEGTFAIPVQKTILLCSAP